MSDARAEIVARIRRSLGRGRLDAATRATIDDRIAHPVAAVVPSRARVAEEARIDLFEDLARRAAATTDRVERLGEVPKAIERYLDREALPAAVYAGADPLLAPLPWSEAARLELTGSVLDASETTRVTVADFGVAETGSVVQLSSSGRRHTDAFLPETHIAVLPAERLVGTMEDVWQEIRASRRVFPRALVYVTGPSRTGDIEVKIELGAHGPRRLHIVIVG